VRNLEEARRVILEGPWASHRDRGGEPIGVCRILCRDSLDVSDVGCAFLPEYRRQGFAYEAAGAVIDYGRHVLGVETIVGLTSQNIMPSIMLSEKLGMRFQKMVKMSADDPGTALFS
jgi:RimJ/RimL family protein N-acetyltransferase